MFDVTAQLVNDQEEIHGLDKIQWEKGSWKHLSLIGDETVINLQRTKVYVFSDSVLCFGRILQHPESNEAWKNRIAGPGKLSIHFTADYSTIETIFHIIVSANRPSLYGAVANMCDEFETHQDRSGERDVLMGQSIVLSEIKAEVPLKMITRHIIMFYGTSMKNAPNCFHFKAK